MTDGARANGHRSLSEHVEALQDWLVKLGYKRSWSRAAVFEGDDIGGWNPEREVDELRFDEIVSTATRHWVNLHAARVEDETLILTVYWIPDPPGRVRREDVSINLSGPTRRHAPSFRT